MNGKPGEPGAFVSDGAREKFLIAYDRAMALWPEPREESDVETDFATTHIVRHGPRDGEPVILLSGAGFNAAGCYITAAPLGAAGYQVFGVDTPGDPNRSVARAAITPPATMAAWLDQVLAAVTDRPAHLIGMSYGGWMALNQAVRAPRRVASVTAIDPAGLTGLSERFWRWLTLNGLASRAPLFLRKHLAAWMGSPFMAVPPMMKVMWAGIRSYKMEPKFPDILSDDELRSITAPVLLLTGSRSALIRPEEARDRARFLTHGEAVVVPGSHGGFDRLDLLNGHIAAFLSAHSAGSPA